MKSKWNDRQIAALTDLLQSPLRGGEFVEEYRRRSGDNQHSTGALHARALSLGQAFNVDVRAICASLRDNKKEEENMSEYVPAKYVADRFGVDPRAVAGNLRILGLEAVRQELSGRGFLLYRKSEIDALPASWEEVAAMAHRKMALPAVQPMAPAPAPTPAPTPVRTRVEPAAILTAWKAGVISEEEMIQKIKALA
jgi:hypothetical protein